MFWETSHPYIKSVFIGGGTIDVILDVQSQVEVLRNKIDLRGLLFEWYGGAHEVLWNNHNKNQFHSSNPK